MSASNAEDRKRIAELEAAITRLDLVTCPVESAGAKIVLRKPRSAESLICDDDFSSDERLPYWADIWPSSRALAGMLRGMPGDGRTLLELGCGVGLVSVTALRADFTVTASDYYRDALEVTRLNALRLVGDGDARLTVRHVDWRALPDDLGPFDVVVAADVLYEREYAQLVSATIRSTLKPGGMAYIADPGRAALEPFREEAKRIGLVETDVLTTLVVPQDAAGDLVARARPGASGLTAPSPGVQAAHKIRVFSFRG
jgi:ETFB lysine methyltransferase